MKINQEEMCSYFEKFDSMEHKFFQNQSVRDDINTREKIAQLFYSHYQGGNDLREICGLTQTIEKVYNYDAEENNAVMNLLNQVTEKFLLEYVDIDSIQELFQSSYFYFEWMMHLEYRHTKHDYSYYRDHYVHQVRNLYEMFKLLDVGLWRDCMEIYKLRGNAVASRMADSVREQIESFSDVRKSVIEEAFRNTEEWCYHYIIYATAIVAALVHDIGYPITYMKTNLDTIQRFLPLSHLFMGLEDGIPRIQSLLSSSLLFETVDNGEIVQKLNKNDHGAYSAIILLCKYYDNGRIFKLEPMKRMVIELSALVIYNHTLRYHFQDEKKYDRYQNVFQDNPISYLFRLCDDMQEWKRVYFQITGKTSFFICNICKTPRIRRRCISQKGSPAKLYEYSCNCGKSAEGINTIQFPYRRVMNVAPFTELEITDVNPAETNTKKKQWILDLKCDKGALLQLVKYNSEFAVQRAKGIFELQGLLHNQSAFPKVFVKAFVSNNPVAIKTMILREFLEADGGELITREHCLDGVDTEEALKKKLRSIIRQIKKLASEARAKSIYDSFCDKMRQQGDGSWENADVQKPLLVSVRFYFFMNLFCEAVGRIEFGDSKEDKQKKAVPKEKRRKKYELAIVSVFHEFAEKIAAQWEIKDREMTDLIEDCIACLYRQVPTAYFFENRGELRYELRTPLRADMDEILKKYTRDPREGEEKKPYDYYSDYFFYYMMNYLK